MRRCMDEEVGASQVRQSNGYVLTVTVNTFIGRSYCIFRGFRCCISAGYREVKNMGQSVLYPSEEMLAWGEKGIAKCKANGTVNEG